ncbi:scaffolding protein [Paenibacillus sp. CAA11]|uniref:phage scaffolding protein n=1 Tax=Paenibacillus sp. CAA11 TaxID=1532905 RepID=UPI000D3527A6|nr:scaffolding protein [Paenibacillus sp. CAA11]AWB45282.1 scaffolding protein [Paenibacillus sp. CAA11]
MKIENTRYRYPLDLQLFAEGDPEPDPAPTPEPEKTFTQAELDQIIADRIARERKKVEKFADYDDIKAKLTDLEKAEEARKKAELTETERLQAELEEARKKAQEAEEAKNGALTAANQRLINAEFRALAREHKIPADRVAAALKLADLSGATVGDDGNPQGVEDAIKALVEANPYLVETAPDKPKPIGGPSGGTATSADKTKEQLLAEAANKARKSGRIEDQAAYAKLKRELGL